MLLEEGDCSVSHEHFVLRQLVQVRESEWRHEEKALCLQAQHRSAGDQDLHIGAGEQKLFHRGSGGDYLLKVVQHQQEMFLAQCGLHLLDQGPLRCFLDAQRTRDGRHHEIGISDRSQANEAHPIGKGRAHDTSSLNGQARLADPARPP